MADPTVCPSLVPLLAAYCNYADILPPYMIDTANAATVTPAEVSQRIYAVAQDGVPNAFLQWNHITSGEVCILHCSTWFQVIPTPMGMPLSP